ncbi:hypothetical protein LWI29_004987 [Acer saccharum]|uniref:Uncharacterized protein n=1 Tax=Acer saccharum TaxID=4024 RepID=A0AA39SZQ6_ACESA|nr:hypothetical protein LWI29_004987 [Acer saccharum]
MPLCDFGQESASWKKVLGLDIVVWWDKMRVHGRCLMMLVLIDWLRCLMKNRQVGEAAVCISWLVFQWLWRLQINSSGSSWWFSGPHIKKACARVYPSIVQHDMVWFWPNTDPEYKDIITKKKPPFIPQMDDPSFSKVWITEIFLTVAKRLKSTLQNCNVRYLKKDNGHTLLLGEEYKCIWPDQQEFVRMAARFGATIVPFGAVGEDDIADLVLDYEDLMKIPVLNDFIKENNHDINLRDEISGEVANQRLFIPGLLPKIPGRFYYLFGKPI